MEENNLHFIERITALEKILTDTTKKVKELEDTNEELGRQVDDLKDDLEEWKYKIQDAESNIEELGNKIDDNEKDVRDLNDKIEELGDTSDLERDMSNMIEDTESRFSTDLDDYKEGVDSELEEIKIQIKQLDWIKRIIDPTILKNEQHPQEQIPLFL